MLLGKQALAQVRPQKSRAAGYEYSHVSPSNGGKIHLYVYAMSDA
jgi:hypothetical protein